MSHQQLSKTGIVGPVDMTVDIQTMSLTVYILHNFLMDYRVPDTFQFPIWKTGSEMLGKKFIAIFATQNQFCIAIVVVCNVK